MADGSSRSVGLLRRLQTVLGSGSKRDALALIPGTAVPGAAAFVGLVIVYRLAGSNAASLLSLARVGGAFGAALIGSGPALAAMRAHGAGRDATASIRWAVLSRGALAGAAVVIVGLLVTWTTGSEIGSAVVLGGLVLVVDAIGLFELSVLRMEGRFTRASALASVQALGAWALTIAAAASSRRFVVIGGAYLAGDVVAVTVFAWRSVDRVTGAATAELRGTWASVIRINVAGYALNNGDQYVIAALIRPSAVAAYAIAYQLGGGVISLVSEPLSGALVPRIMKEWAGDARGRATARATAFRGAAVELGVGALAVALILLAGATGLLRLLIRSSSLAPIAAIIAGATSVNAASSLAFVTRLFAAHRERAWNRATWAALGVSLVAVPALTLAFGITGTAVATLIGYGALGALLALSMHGVERRVDGP